MKIYDVEQRSEKWHELRQGRVTGTVLKRILGTPATREQVFYEVLAERLSIEAQAEESALDRGVKYEDEAIKAYEKAYEVEVEKIGFTTRLDNKWIASSPDGYVKTEKKYQKAVEVKCLSSANHVKAWIKNEVPKEFRDQGLQYFIVNDDLLELDFIFYDPRITVHPLHVITLTRKDLKEDIEEARKTEEEFIKKVEDELAKRI